MGRISILTGLCFAMTSLCISPTFARASSHGADHVLPLATPQGVKAKTLKGACTALAYALRSGTFARFITYLEANSTKEVIRTVTKNAATIAKALEYAVTWEELSMAMVRDQVSHALRSAGVAESAAKTAAFWIQELLGAALF